MKVDPGLIESANLPRTAFEIVYDFKGFRYIIKNPIYAQIFWLHLWHNKFAQEYANQNMIVDLAHYDLTTPIVLDQDFNLLSAPPTVQGISYYANFDEKYKPWFLLPFTMSSVLIFFGICLIVILIFTQTTIKNSFLMNLT